MTKIENSVSKQLIKEKNGLDDYVKIFSNTIKTNFKTQTNELEKFDMRIKHAVSNFIGKQKNQLAVFKEKAELLDPSSVFKRGFSISLINGSIVKSVKEVKKGDTVETKLIDGSFKSKVEN
jgi:exodeoxyribonuclease VII large subunit